MQNSGSQHFFSLPTEIQQLILWKCLEGWSARVEVHEKPRGPGQRPKETTRVWSSHIYDNLMISRTCKYFHQTVQAVQKDPRLFTGQLDLIEANAALPYLIGYSETSPDAYEPRLAHPPFRTQVFIKAAPYDRNNPDWRLRRCEYHTEVRDWLIHNTTYLGIWADELRTHVPWSKLSNLKEVNIFWQHLYFFDTDNDFLVCEHKPDSIIQMAKGAKNFGGYIGPENFRLMLLSVPLAKSWQITLTLEVPHLHVKTPDWRLPSGLLDWDKYSKFEFYKLDCVIEVGDNEWKLVSAKCCGEEPIIFEGDTFWDIGDLLDRVLESRTLQDDGTT